jgi:hypothetical protein
MRRGVGLLHMAERTRDEQEKDLREDDTSEGDAGNRAVKSSAVAPSKTSQGGVGVDTEDHREEGVSS